MATASTKRVRLGDVLSVKARIGWQGLTQKEHMKSGDYRLVTGVDFCGGFVNFDNCVYVSRERYEQDPYIQLKENDILLTKDGTIGKVAVVGHLEVPATLNSGVFVLRDIGNHFNVRYLYHYFLAPNFRGLIDRQLTGCTIPHLNQKILVALQIPLPPLAEQKRIAGVLDKISAMKRNAEARVQKLDLLVKSRFVEMFGDPVANSLGLPTTLFENVVRLQRGFDLPVQDRKPNGDVPIFGSNGMVGFHTEARAYDGVITGRSGTIGNVYCAKGAYWPLNTSLFSVDTHGNEIVYLSHLLKLFHLERFQAGTGVPTLNRNDVHRQLIIDVGHDEQMKFAAFVEKVEKLKATAQRECEQVDLLYRAKLQEYFG